MFLTYLTFDRSIANMQQTIVCSVTSSGHIGNGEGIEPRGTSKIELQRSTNASSNGHPQEKMHVRNFFLFLYKKIVIKMPMCPVGQAGQGKSG